MSATLELVDVCRSRPTDQNVQKIANLIAAGADVSVTIEDCVREAGGPEEPVPQKTIEQLVQKWDPSEASKASGNLEGNTSLLHVLFYNVEADLNEAELKALSAIVDRLLMEGIAWNLIDYKGNTPGCILNERLLHTWEAYKQIVLAGLRSELLFRKMEEFQKVMGDQDSDDEEKVEDSERPADQNEAFLATSLSYTLDSLVTESSKHGVMMNWETKLMKLGADALFKGIPENNTEEVAFLNIGFGMGIIDGFIQENIANYNKEHPDVKVTHYISEAHPNVLAKMKQDGWYEKPSVVVLEGRWQDLLAKLLDQGGVFFNGVYYDTFSEHYHPDMYPNLFDALVGLLQPEGVISFFNGLGADRKVVYDVYKKVVAYDLADLGLDVTYEEIPMDASEESKKLNGDENVWKDVKRSYWNCDVYYHPEIRFV